jgi:hypothetical protein
LEKDWATTLTFSKGADSVDFALVNRVLPGDIVITQDYGLAAMCLSKNAIVINQDGIEYTSDNIDALLLARYTAQKIRNSGGRLKGPRKRSAVQDEQFKTALTRLLDKKGNSFMKAEEANKHYAYMLRCVDGTIYSGYATDPVHRTAVHNSGRGAKYTRSRLPVELVFCECFPSKNEALEREAALKKLCHAEKLLLISQYRGY